MSRIFKYLLMISLLLSCTFSQALNRGSSTLNSISHLTGEDYLTGEDGVPRITLNIWGNVKYPGTYLIYDGVDLLTALSIAGGPLKGSKLSEIRIVSKNGKVTYVDLQNQIDNSEINTIIIAPFDTIYVDETLGNYILSRGNVINVLIQITNLILIASSR